MRKIILCLSLLLIVVGCSENKESKESSNDDLTTSENSKKEEIEVNEYDLFVDDVIIPLFLEENWEELYAELAVYRYGSNSKFETLNNEQKEEIETLLSFSSIAEKGEVDIEYGKSILGTINPNYSGICSKPIKDAVLSFFDNNAEEWNQIYLASVEADEKRNAPEPAIGMTADEVRESKWGKPQKVNKTTTKYGVDEQWVYPNYKYIYLEDGIVTAIQE